MVDLSGNERICGRLKKNGGRCHEKWHLLLNCVILIKKAVIGGAKNERQRDDNAGNGKSDLFKR